MGMGTIGNEMNPGYPRGESGPIGPVAIILGLLLFSMSSMWFPVIVSATTIYSYIDDQGTPVLTDNLESIPARYRAKVQTTEQAPKEPPSQSAAIRLQQKVSGWAHRAGKGLETFTPGISGLTAYQSRIVTFGGLAAVFCLITRLLVRSQVVKFLSLWCLIMLGLTVPALFFTSQNAPLDLLRGQSEKIQEKQQEHLQPAR